MEVIESHLRAMSLALQGEGREWVRKRRNRCPFDTHTIFNTASCQDHYQIQYFRQGHLPCSEFSFLLFLTLSLEPPTSDLHDNSFGYLAWKSVDVDWNLLLSRLAAFHWKWKHVLIWELVANWWRTNFGTSNPHSSDSLPADWTRTSHRTTLSSLFRHFGRIFWRWV